MFRPAWRSTFSARKQTPPFFRPSTAIRAEYAAPPGYGPCNALAAFAVELLRADFLFIRTKGLASCFASGEAPADVDVQKLLLAGSGGLRHLRGKPLRTALHFFRRDDLHLLCEAPLMAEGVGQLAIAIGPKLICARHVHLGARSDSAAESSVHVF